MSATVRVITPFVARPSRSTATLVTRPRVGFSPTRPLHDAGMRIEPPPSAAWAMGAIPAATAAPAPLEDPPGVRPGSQGLREIPRASLSVNGTVPNSEVVVLPSRTKPASWNRRTTGSDAVAGVREAPADPCVVGQPATSTRSLIGSGTPWNGGRSSVEVVRTTASAAAAADRTSSSARWQNTLRSGSRSSMRSRYMSTTSTGLTSPRRMAVASSTAGVNASMGARMANCPSSWGCSPVSVVARRHRVLEECRVVSAGDGS